VAQERKKRRIVIASILKPVDDTRMMEKIGMSLQQAGYDVTVVGYPAKSLKVWPGIRVISLPAFARLSTGRIKARWTVLIKAWQERPDFFIFTTHELMGTALLLKIFSNTTLVYDVRENYYRNIRYSEAFPRILRLPLAAMVRFKEKLLAPMIDHFLLAERAYESEFRFHRGGWTVIENKAVGIEPLARKRGGRRLLFSGTLAVSTGVFRAINLAILMHQQDPKVTLTIAGYAASRQVQEKLAGLAQVHSWITLVGITELVSHEVIVQRIHESDLALVAYPPAHHTEGSRPTKLYEYLSAGLPMVIEGHWPWVTEFTYCQPFIIIDYDHPDIQALMLQWDQGHFYPVPAKDVTWADEAAKLLKALAGSEAK
jgi:glycosyltransferase involved in cell wall biosynthesis